MEVIKNETKYGVKFDTEKPRMDLVLGDFADALLSVGEVGTYGANKYDDSNWLKVDGLEERYLSAMLRHYLAYKSGEIYDTESELPHLSHMTWNALAVLQHWIMQSQVHKECKCGGKCNCKSSEEAVREHIYNNDIDDNVRSIMYSFYGYNDIE